MDPTEALRLIPDLTAAVRDAAAVLRDLREHAPLYVAELGAVIGAVAGLTRFGLERLFNPR